MVKTTRTVRIDHRAIGQRADIDPFTLGARTGLLWQGNGRTLAGIGEHQRVTFSRPGGFVEVQAALAAMAGADEVDGPGSGPVAFGALPFDPDAAGTFIVPEVIVAAGPAGQRWITYFSDGGDGGTEDGTEDGDEAVERILADAMAMANSGIAAGPEPTELRLRTTMTPENWRDQVVTATRDQIRDGAIDKCVVARELIVTADAPFDSAVVMKRLAQTFPTANLFSIDGFIGASPEMLVARLDDVVRAHPLAGTLPRSTDPDRDRTLAAELLASDKNRWEHRITIDWLLDNLLPFCSYVDAEPEPSIVSLANVHHLGTKVEGRLSSPSASILELVGALHPTPAVGGDPQKAALRLIDEIEQAERGLYAGPVGWVDADGNGQFAVAIRSAHFEGPDQVRLFAGVGVVADSEPQAELDETRAKFKAILGALVQP